MAQRGRVGSCVQNIKTKVEGVEKGSMTHLWFQACLQVGNRGHTQIQLATRTNELNSRSSANIPGMIAGENT